MDKEEKGEYQSIRLAAVVFAFRCIVSLSLLGCTYCFSLAPWSVLSPCVWGGDGCSRGDPENEEGRGSMLKFLPQVSTINTCQYEPVRPNTLGQG